MAYKMLFVLSVVVAVLYREMLFTNAQNSGYGANNGAVPIGVKQGFPPQRQMTPGQWNKWQMFPRQMNPGQMNPGQMNPGQMNPGQMNPGQMNPGQMNPGQMNPGQMNPGQMNPGQMNPGQMNPGQRNPGQRIPGQRNPILGSNGVGLPGTFGIPNGARQPGAGRPSTYDTLMDVSKQLIRQLTPLAEVVLSAPASYGQAWATAPRTAIRRAQPIPNGAVSGTNWG